MSTTQSAAAIEASPSLAAQIASKPPLSDREVRELLARCETRPARRSGTYHRDSKFMRPVQVETDRNKLAKLLWQARVDERRSRDKKREKAQAEKAAQGRKKAKPVHRGAIGDRAIEVLRVLLFEIPKLNGLHPTLETLMRWTGLSKPTLIEAIKRLVDAGFLTVYRRIMRRQDGRVVQTSNSYEPHPPVGLGALGWSSSAWVSGLKNLTERKSINNKNSFATNVPAENPGKTRGGDQSRQPSGGG